MPKRIMFCVSSVNPANERLTRRCFFIPLVPISISQFPPHIHPDPPPEGPLPEPWFLSEDVSREAQYRLQVLATIHALADGLEGGARDHFQKLALDSIGKLPVGVEIGVH